jgi:hypothetical protein
MAEPPAFARRQRAFAAHIRDPRAHPGPPDVEDRRMAIYRELFYTNVESLLAGNFPVLRRLLDDDHWHDLVRGFYARHRCETPLFPEIAQELLDYLANERKADPRDPPFLLELAHYEWVELALAVSDAEPDLAAADPNGDLLSGVPVVSPLAWNLSYRFPVHRIGPDFRPQAPGAEPTHLVVYRDRQDRVGFLEINAVTQRLLTLLQEHLDWCGEQALNQIARELQHPDPALVMTSGSRLMRDLREREILLGTRRGPS